LSKIWIFDLDDTLHDASSKIFPCINQSMTAYVEQKLKISHQDAHELRDQYWKVYGATLKGLMENHSVDPKEFLVNTHDAEELSKFVKQSHSLKNTLKKLKGKKLFLQMPRFTMQLQLLNHSIFKNIFLQSIV